MSDFYGKRFLSSLVGALTVLGSPVASAGKNGSDRGDLGKGVHSAGRNKNNGSLGKLKSNREVKSVDGLKKVLKETGGKVVRVSPDGKGGFVAFVKTPTGIVTVAIVGVPLLVVLGLVASYVFNGANVFKNASGELLHDLFDDNQKKYDSFVKKLFNGFFNDASKVFIGNFDKCNKNLDEFLKVVFGASSFSNGGILWKIGIVSGDVCRVLNFGGDFKVLHFEGLSVDTMRFYTKVFEYLGKKGLVIENVAQVNWGVKIASLLFSFWFLAEYDLKPGSSKVGEILEAGNNNFKGIFDKIHNYVKDRLKAADKNDNGQKLEPAN